MKKLISALLLLLTFFSVMSVSGMNVTAAAASPYGEIEDTASPFAMPPMPDLTAADDYVLTLSVHEVTIGVGEKYQLKPTVKVPTGASKEVGYSVQNSDVISVNANGVVTGRKEGTSGDHTQGLRQPEPQFAADWAAARDV